MKGAHGWLIRWDFSSVGKSFSKDHEERLGGWAKHPHPHTFSREDQMKRTVMMIVVAIGFVCGSMVLAQDAPPQERPRFDFRSIDKNGDGKISRDEFPGPPQFFDRVDANGDGFLTEEEMGRMRQGPGNRPRLGDNLVKQLDADQNGKVSQEEFAKIIDAFSRLDRDGDGWLTNEEMNGLAAVSLEAGNPEVNALFKMYDVNKDDKLSEEELKADSRFSKPQYFKILDKDKDGSVTKGELEQFLNSLQKASK
jgi:Ca2+-binding EF-hand superfamily protein